MPLNNHTGVYIRLLCALVWIFAPIPEISAAVCSEYDYEISSNADLEAIAAEQCNEVAGKLRLEFSDGDDYDNVDALLGITTVGGNLEINAGHEFDLSGLRNITSVGGSLFVFHDKLRSLEGLHNIESVGQTIHISRNNALRDLDGLRGVTEAGGDILIDYNPSLVDIDGLRNLTHIGTLQIGRCDYCTAGVGYGGGAITILDNDNLRHIDGLEGITAALVIILRFNNKLQNVDGLINLREVGDVDHPVSGKLEIAGNSSLNNLDGLRNLPSIFGDLTVQENVALSNCDGISQLIGNADDYPWENGGASENDLISKYVAIANNADGCNSPDEVAGRYASGSSSSGDATVDSGTSGNTETFKVTLEEPANNGIASGISNVRGWAVSSQGIQKVELFVDGQYAYEIPYGGQRLDVEAVFPEIPQSAESGFGQTYNYGRLSLGGHTMTVRAYAGDGTVKDSTKTFTVVGFGQEFISASDSPSTDNASASIESSNGDIVIRDVELDSGEKFEVRLRWDTAAQSYKAVAVQPFMENVPAP